MLKMLTALGLMSGTSIDGVDAAIIRTDGENVEITEHFLTLPYEKATREKIKKLILLPLPLAGEGWGGGISDLRFQISNSPHLTSPRKREEVNNVEREITEIHADAVKELLKSSKIKPDIIGFHGHTIDHRPDEGFTWQIGDGALLAKLTGVDVVNDFRSADVKAGGQGAPLVPLYHAAIVRGEKKPVAILNIGGVANVTYIDEKNIIAFDTGPGNALIDDWIYKHTGKYFDDGGAISAKGKIREDYVKEFLDDDFFTKKPPKSLDRNEFKKYADLKGFSLEDGAATLTAFTIESIKYAVKHFPSAPEKWFITGGGRHNKTLMEGLKSEDGSQKRPSTILPIESLGLNGDALEAQAFAFLAVRSLKKLPLSLPSTTGIKKSSVTGGVFYPA